MHQSFDACLAFTRREEGGLSLNARDPGCYLSGIARDGDLIGSNCGISAATLADWLRPQTVTSDLMRNLRDETVAAIYRTKYWMAVSGDSLPAGVDMMVWDFAVNDGVGASARVLQRCLGVAEDGWIGPQTLAAIPAADRERLIDLMDANGVHGLQQILGVATDGVVGPQTRAAISRLPALSPMLLITALTSQQSRHYRSIGGFKVFGNGWLARTNRRQMAAYHIAMIAAGA